MGPWNSDAAPGRALRAVHEHDALVKEGLADFVGAGEVLRLLGLAAFLDQGVDAGLVGIGGAALEEVLGIKLQDVEHGAQALELAHEDRIARAVDLGGELEHRGDGERRVEVVVHRGLELGGVLLAPVDLAFGSLATLEGPVEAHEGLLGLLNERAREADRAAVLAAQQEEAEHFGAVALAVGGFGVLESVADRPEVAERLGHLLLVAGGVAHAQRTRVHPDLGERHAGGGLALGDLVLMVREDEVGTAAVDVERVAEDLGAHGRALDVPARTAAAPLGFPLGLARLGALPEHEVERIALAGSHVDAGARLQVVDRLAGEAAIVLELAHGEVDVTVGPLVGVALLLKLLDEAEHFGDVVGGAGLVRGREAAEREHVLLHRAAELLGELGRRDAALGSAADDLVVDVRDVAHEGHLHAGGLEPAAHDVEGHEGAAVADVAVVVDRHAADVHADVVGFDRGKGGLRAAERRIDRKCHG